MRPDFARPGWAVADALVGAPFDEPIELPKGRKLVTLKDAAAYIMKLPGHLCSGVAHDFNNVLGNIQACLKLLKRHFKAEGAEQLIDEGMRCITRGKSLTDRMLDFARQQPAVLKTVDLNRLINNAADVLTRTLGVNVLINAQAAPNLWHAIGDLIELEVAILNIAINARDAVPKGGILTIAAENITVFKGEIQGLHAGDYIALSFKDTGVGMPAEARSRVLNPFIQQRAKVRALVLV